MEFLLKAFTQRNLLIALAIAGLACAAVRLEPHTRQLYLAWRYPPQKGASPGGDEILALLEKRASMDLARRHEQVTALLDQAEAEGFEVAALRRKAALALKLNDARNRALSTKLLVEVEMNAPRRKVQYIPLYPSDEEADIPPDLPGRRVKRRR